jgi:hypothetical protein
MAKSNEKTKKDEVQIEAIKALNQELEKIKQNKLLWHRGIMNCPMIMLMPLTQLFV